MPKDKDTIRDRVIFLAVSTVIVILIRTAARTPLPKADYHALEPVTLFVATDLHYLAPELTDNGPYFQELIASADGKAMEYCEEIMDAFLGQVIEQKPDALILSGDLTFNGAELSHAALAEKLLSLEKAGIPVLVLPGNHDLENPMAASFQGTGYTLVESAGPQQFETIYQEFGLGEAIARDSNSLSYVAELRPGLRVLMMDVNTVEAPGVLTEQTLRWAERQLQSAARQGAYVIAVGHQNLLPHNSLFSFGFVMGNNESLLALYEKYGVLCSLSGHMHVQHITQSEEGLPEIATSSLMVFPNQYGVLTLNGTAAEYQTAAVPVREEVSTDAQTLLWDTSLRLAAEELGGNAAGNMIRFFMDVNTAYISGRMDMVTWDDAMFQRWKDRQTFLYVYLQSILDDGFQNHTEYAFTFGETDGGGKST